MFVYVWYILKIVFGIFFHGFSGIFVLVCAVFSNSKGDAAQAMDDKSCGTAPTATLGMMQSQVTLSPLPRETKVC